MFRRFPLALAALGASAGVALWLTLGSFDLVIRGREAVRVAMLPPLWQLPVLILGLWALLAGLFSLLTRWSAATAAQLPPANDADAAMTPADRALDALKPLGASGLLVLPFLPWLPDAVPALRLLGGPARLLVWFVILAQVARLAWRLRPPMPRADRAWQAPLAIALVTLALCGGAASGFLRSAFFPGGDEPHYLVMAQSLWRDGDLRIENNHRQGDYHEYFAGDLAPHYLTRGLDGQIYSVHPIGMPVLMAPIYALGGYDLVAWMMVAFATGAATLFWMLARRLTGSSTVATVAWAACCLTGPFIFNSFTVYPEIPAALATMIAFTLALPRSRWQPRLRTLDAVTPGTAHDTRAHELAARALWPRALACGAAAATLPWFSTKYAPLSAALIAIAFFRLWLPWPSRAAAASRDNASRDNVTESDSALFDDGALPNDGTVRARIAATVALGLPYAISLAGWFTYFYVTWGKLSPSAPYGSQRGAGLRFLPAGGPGLLFDQEYGVMAFAPALLLALTGLAAMLRRGGAARRLALEVTLAFGALLATVGAFHIWWGGSATVGRPLMSGFLLLGLPIAWRYQDRRARAGSVALTHVAIAIGAAVALALAFAQEGFLLVAGREGNSMLLEWLSPSWSASKIAPSFIAQPPAAAMLVSLVWLLAAGALGWGLACRRTQAPGRAALTALVSTMGVLALASLIVPALARALGPTAFGASTPEVVTTQQRSRLLDTFDATRRPLAIVFDPFRRLDPAAVPALVQFTVRPDERRPRQPVPLLYNARWALPAGRYTITLLFPRGVDSATLQGMLALRVGRVGAPAQTWDISLSPPAVWGRSFDLPVDSNLVGFVASADVMQAAPELRLTPDDVVDASRRLPPVETLGAATIGDTRVYFHDERVWLGDRGFWTPGDASVAVTLAPPPGRRAAMLRLRAGAVKTTVRIRAGGRDERIELAPHATHDLSVSAGDRRDGPIRLTLDTAPGFVPAHLEPGNPDERRLGCFVELLNP